MVTPNAAHVWFPFHSCSPYHTSWVAVWTVEPLPHFLGGSVDCLAWRKRFWPKRKDLMSLNSVQIVRGRGSPILWRTSLNFPKLCVGVAVINSVICWWDLSLKRPRAALKFSSICSFLQSLFIYLGQENWPSNVPSWRIGTVDLRRK